MPLTLWQRLCDNDHAPLPPIHQSLERRTRLCFVPGSSRQGSSHSHKSVRERRRKHKWKSPAAKLWQGAPEGREGKPDPGLFLYNNTGEEGQADRTVISLQGAKAKTLSASLGLEELARGPVRWAGAMISEARNLRRAGPRD